MTYSVILERSDDGGWSALVPDLPGLLLMGDTREELIETAPRAIADHIDVLRDDGLPLPTPGQNIVHIDVLAA